MLGCSRLITNRHGFFPQELMGGKSIFMEVFDGHKLARFAMDSAIHPAKLPVAHKAQTAIVRSPDLPGCNHRSTLLLLDQRLHNGLVRLSLNHHRAGLFETLFKPENKAVAVIPLRGTAGLHTGQFSARKLAEENF